MEVKFIFISVFPYSKDAHGVSVTVKEQVTNSAHDMMPLDTHTCVRVEARMQAQTPKCSPRLFLDFVSKGGLNFLLWSLPKFSQISAMSIY